VLLTALVASSFLAQNFVLMPHSCTLSCNFVNVYTIRYHVCAHIPTQDFDHLCLTANCCANELLQVPAGVNSTDWSTLADSSASADAVGLAVTNIITSIHARLSLESPTASTAYDSVRTSFLTSAELDQPHASTDI